MSITKSRNSIDFALAGSTIVTSVTLFSIRPKIPAICPRNASFNKADCPPFATSLAGAFSSFTSLGCGATSTSSSTIPKRSFSCATYFSASREAIAPSATAVTTWRNTLGRKSPAA